MHRSRHKHIGLFACIFLVALFAAPVLLTWRAIQQDHLNRALLAAVKRNDAQTAILLLEQGADANTVDEPARKETLWQMVQNILHRRRRSPTGTVTAFHLALGWYKPRIATPLPVRLVELKTPLNSRLVNAFLDHGADVNTGINGITPLMLAVSQGDKSLVRRLMTDGADVNAFCPDTSLLIFILGSSPVQMDGRAVFLDGGAMIGDAEGKRPTASDLAAQFRHADIVRLLKRSGAKGAP